MGATRSQLPSASAVLPMMLSSHVVSSSSAAASAEGGRLDWACVEGKRSLKRRGYSDAILEPSSVWVACETSISLLHKGEKVSLDTTAARQEGHQL